MAYSFTGIGTTFYGKRDFRADRSYTTTEWVSFFYFPVFPLRSLRVVYQGPAERRFPFGFGWAESYAVHEKMPPNWKQVCCIYGYALFMVCWTLLLLEICCNMENAIPALSLFFGGSLLAVLVPWILRYYARRKLQIRPT
jgi:hypothetical protein